MKGIININTDAVRQYFLIYLLLQYQGGRLLMSLGSDIFYSFVLCVCIVGLIVLMRSRTYSLSHFPSYLGVVIVIFLYLILSIFYTNGGMSIGTPLSITSRFLLIYLIVVSNPEQFVSRFVKMIVVFAIVSDIIYFSHFIGLTPLWSTLSRFFYHMRSGSEFAGDTYGLFFIVFKTTDLTRNSYMFGEPGEYQIVINSALFFLLLWQKRLNFTEKRRILSLIVLLITMLTIQSTSGFLNLIAIIVCTILQAKSLEDKKSIRILMIAVIGVLVYVSFFASADSIFYTSFYDKIFSSSGQVDVSESTGSARWNPFLTLQKAIVYEPMYVFFGVGPNGLGKTLLGKYTANGLVNLIMSCGLFFTIGISIYMFWKAFKHNSGILSVVAAMFIYINQAMGQPEIINGLPMLILMYGYFYDTYIDNDEIDFIEEQGEMNERSYNETS